MKRILPHPLLNTPENLMIMAGYSWHCMDAGRACYHRCLNDAAFPRFHALIHMIQSGMEIDLHFDALDSIHHKSNHDQPWAYEGGRVNEEMRRMIEAMCGRICLNQVYRPPTSGSLVVTSKPKKKRNFFDLLFKSM